MLRHVVFAVAVLALLNMDVGLAGEPQPDQEVGLLWLRYKNTLEKSCPGFRKCADCKGTGTAKVAVTTGADGNLTSGRAWCTECCGTGWQPLLPTKAEQAQARANLQKLAAEAAALAEKKKGKLGDSDRKFLETISTSGEEAQKDAVPVRPPDPQSVAVPTYSVWRGRQSALLEEVIPKLQSAWENAVAAAKASLPSNFTYKTYTGLEGRHADGEFVDNGAEWRDRSSRSLRIHDQAIAYGEKCRKLLESFGFAGGDFLRAMSPDMAKLKQQRATVLQDRGRKGLPRN